jgi:diguanylate cyclase (GGDEF)-like protein
MTRATRDRWILSLLALLLAASVAAAYRASADLALRQVERILDGRIEAHRWYFLDKLGKYSQLPETIGSVPEVRQLLLRPEAAGARTVNRVLQEIAAKVNCERIFVMDARGIVVADSKWRDPDAIIGNGLSHRAYFQQAMAGRTGQFIGVGSTSRIVGYFTSRPVTADGRIVGVVAIRLSETMRAFESILQRNWKERGELVLAADNNDIVYMSALPEWTFKAVSLLDAKVIGAIRASRQYGEHDFAPIAAHYGAAPSNELRSVQFDEIPGRTFLQKGYDVPETEGRTYVHLDAAEYWRTVALYTGSAGLAALAVFLATYLFLQRWRHQQALVEAAVRDPLTGLYTRLFMQEWLTDAIHTHARDKERGFGLLLFDVDKFKAVNDTYGHVAGDEVLKGVARIVAGAVRAIDIPVRFGGEEIAVLARGVDFTTAEEIGERIRAQIEIAGVHTSRGHIPVTISGGIALHEPGEDQAALFERADARLYRAKSSGRNRICAD